MKEALSLARSVVGSTSPNPAVGAVIVKDGNIIGRGATQPPGSLHAEIVALMQAKDNSEGAILYSTLEPCCHYGRTPPCTEAIIQAGITRVVVAMLDPNPLVSGQGIKRLAGAGIEITVGDSQHEASEIVEAYAKYITSGMPFVTCKFAMSLDGKIATFCGDSKWISGQTSRNHSHLLRYRHDAIMAGINTILKDDPQLTVRLSSEKHQPQYKQPVRIIVDGYGRTPLDAQIFSQPGNTVIAVGENVSSISKRNLNERGAEILELPVVNGFVNLVLLMKELGKREITSVLVEGGSSIMGSMFDHNLVDKVVAFVAPVIIGGDSAKTPVGGQGVEILSNACWLHHIKVDRFDKDVMITGYTKEQKCLPEL